MRGVKVSVEHHIDYAQHSDEHLVSLL